MPDLSEQIARNLADVRARIADAAASCGRAADEITLVAITKYVGEPEIRALVEAGCTVLGENRPQALWDKAEACADLPIHWHMVGHLQTNKVKTALNLFDIIQSVDSLHLAEAISKRVLPSVRVPVLMRPTSPATPRRGATWRAGRCSIRRRGSCSWWDWPSRSTGPGAGPTRRRWS